MQTKKFNFLTLIITAIGGFVTGVMLSDKVKENSTLSKLFNKSK